MTTPNLLQYELAILLARYGRDRVVKELAAMVDSSEPELTATLAEILRFERIRPASQQAHQESFSLSSLCDPDSDKGKKLATLLARFEAKRFLPELKDVRRFLDRHQNRKVALRSRKEALKPVFECLARFELGDLDALTGGHAETHYSSLGIISDEILRRPKD